MPMPQREKILVIATNLFFMPRIQNIAAPSGCNTRQVMTIDRLKEEMADGETVLVLVDLEADPDFWGEAVGRVLASGPSRPQVVGYGGHTNTEMLQRAEEAGRLRPRTDKRPIQPRPRQAHSGGRRVSRHERLTIRNLTPSPHFLPSPPYRNSPYILFGTFADAIVVSRSCVYRNDRFRGVYVRH